MIITKGNFDTIAMEACCTMSKSVIVVFWVSLDTRERESSAVAVLTCLGQSIQVTRIPSLVIKA